MPYKLASLNYKLDRGHHRNDTYVQYILYLVVEYGYTTLYMYSMYIRIIPYLITIHTYIRKAS